MTGQNFTKFCIHIIIDKIYVWIVKRHFLQICNRVTAPDLCQNLVLLNILRMNGQNLTKICVHTIKIYVGIVTRHQFSNRVMPLKFIFVLCPLIAAVAGLKSDPLTIIVFVVSHVNFDDRIWF